MTDTPFHTEDPAGAGLDSAALDRLDDALSGFVDRGELAGLSYMVARRGRVGRVRVFGRQDLESGTPLSRRSIFRIFSMTKPVTGVAMMKLFERGVWRPDDPISKFLPAFADLKVIDPERPADPLAWSAPDHAPTMLELMTHTAGFSYGWDPDDPTDAAYQEARPLAADSLADMVDRLSRLPLAYQPGQRWRYSLSMDIQGAIIEAVTGRSLPDFMRDEIFEPLGMADTGFFLPQTEADRLCALYRMSSKGGLKRVERALFGGSPHVEPTLPLGGGGLYSTLDDYARFAQMLLSRGAFGGARILSPDSVAFMASNHLSDAILAGGFGVGFQQIRPGYGHGVDCAVFHDPALAGSPVGRGTFQWDGAAGTWFWVDPETDLFFVGLVQRFALPGSPALAAISQARVSEAVV